MKDVVMMAHARQHGQKTTKDEVENNSKYDKEKN